MNHVLHLFLELGVLCGEFRYLEIYLSKTPFTATFVLVAQCLKVHDVVGAWQSTNEELTATTSGLRGAVIRQLHCGGIVY